jgi:hypothetical protein
MMEMIVDDALQGLHILLCHIVPTCRCYLTNHVNTKWGIVMESFLDGVFRRVLTKWG